MQKISRPKLIGLLQEARDAMPAKLGHVSDTIDHFVQRVEDRSSLLRMTGYDVENGRLVEFFEFNHLTFQEFLTAQAIVEGYYRNRKKTDTLTSVLEPYFKIEGWHEVIPLAAVLSGDAADALIQRLTETVKLLQCESLHDKNPLFQALGSCLADEANAGPETVRSAIRELVRLGRSLRRTDFAPILACSQYGKDLCEVASNALIEPDAKDLEEIAEALTVAIRWQSIETEDAGWIKAAEGFIKMVGASEQIARCKGILGIKEICFLLRENPDGIKACTNVLRCAGTALIPILYTEQPAELFSACLALVWLGTCRVWLPPAKPDVLGQLFRLWQQNTNASVKRTALWAITSQTVMPRDIGQFCTSVAREELQNLLVGEQLTSSSETREAVATLVLDWYLHALSNSDIRQLAGSLLKTCHLDPHHDRRVLLELLDQLDK